MKDLKGYTIATKDGPEGKIKDILFDEDSWVVRYFETDFGSVFNSNRILISVEIVTDNGSSKSRFFRIDNQVNEIPSNRILRIEVLADAIIHWTNDDWNTIEVTETKDTCTGIFLADIPVNQASGNQITFTFYWKEPQSWEKRNFEVNIQKVEETVAEEKFTMHQP